MAAAGFLLWQWPQSRADAGEWLYKNDLVSGRLLLGDDSTFQLSIEMGTYVPVRADIQGRWEANRDHVLLVANTGETIPLERSRSGSSTLEFITGQSVNELDEFARDLTVRSMTFVRADSKHNR